MRVGIICGGPSLERGISLNSARSSMDNLKSGGWTVATYYCDQQRNLYRISPALLYSNTPSDFDFKLNVLINDGQVQLFTHKKEFIDALKHETDIILPCIHGEFGEDGQLQKILEDNHIPFVGSPSNACRIMFDKISASKRIAELGYTTLPYCVVEKGELWEKQIQSVRDFFERNCGNKFVVKPSSGGSSIEVKIVKSPKDAVCHARKIFEKKISLKVIIEPFCKGHEFTIIVLENKKDEPVALIPTEIELITGDNKKRHRLFTTRDKYLPSQDVKYHCPPRIETGFNEKIINKIQKTAENLFSHFGMKDFSRLDGWLMDDGKVIFSDINPVSGMEQNSFLFIAGSRIGLTHSELISNILFHALVRNNTHISKKIQRDKSGSRKICVIFGGETSERDVSLMSGTNVWLKLLAAPNYDPSPYLLTSIDAIWKLPYGFTLCHTTDEIVENCVNADVIISRLQRLVPTIRQRLYLEPLKDADWINPRQMSFEKFCEVAKKENAFIFNALHGGKGEDGTIQKILNHHKLSYNGSDSDASQLCMDKFETGNVIKKLNDPLLISAPKKLVSSLQSKNAENIWQDAKKELKTADIIIKPQSDGCSTGIVRLSSASDLRKYLREIEKEKKYLKAGTVKYQSSRIKLPEKVDSFILEPFIKTIKICPEDIKSHFAIPKGWIELTVGVLENNKRYHSLWPSITLAEDNVLSVEEKFQGGTGVNITPPPKEIISNDQVIIIKNKLEKAAKILGIQGYARIDIFFNTMTNETMVIEANTLPGLTPSTVIYHQALAEKTPLTPIEFLSKLIMFGVNRRKINKALMYTYGLDYQNNMII
jgi:D-alanine--D-alanine ligase